MGVRVRFQNRWAEVSGSGVEVEFRDEGCGWDRGLRSGFGTKVVVGIGFHNEGRGVRVKFQDTLP